jgi:hypothetical protein
MEYSKTKEPFPLEVTKSYGLNPFLTQGGDIKSFSDIYMMDILTGKEEALTDKRRFISSCLSSKELLLQGLSIA